MLCDTCKNKHICKFYDCFNSATIKLVVQVNECELYSNNNSAPVLIHNPSYKNPEPLYRQPLPSTYVDKEEEEDDIEDEERVYINIDNYSEPKNETIVDILLKGDDTKHD